MQRPLLRFRVAGIPVDVQPMFILVLAGMAIGGGDLTAAAIWAAVAAVSVLWHELGHALTMRQFGHAARIELVAFGGLAHWPPGADPSARQELAVTAAGPGAGLALGAAVWALSAIAPPTTYLQHLVVRDLVWINVAWSLFNLLPMLPLDGGRILDHLSRLVAGAREPRWVGWASLATGSAVVAAGVWWQSPYVAIIGLLCAAQGLARARRPGASGRDVFARERAAARRAEARGDRAGVVSALLRPARGGWLDEPELARLVAAMVETHQHDALVALCHERLGAFARRGDAEPLARLASEALTDAGASEDALEVSQAAFQQLRIAYHAWDAACHLAALNRPEEAIAWLGRAVDAGLPCAEQLRDDPALDRLRDRDDFQRLASAARAGPRVTRA